MQLRFTKMHGLGNDFVVLDLITQRFNLSARHVRHLADRRFGVGCDQVLVVEVPQQTDVDFRYRIFNADGSEVEQCGNGARCFAKFVRDKKLTGKRTLRVETKAGVIELRMADNRHIHVDMGEPILEPSQIPIVANSQLALYSIEIRNRNYAISAVSMGNPHAVLQVDDIDTADVANLGPAIEGHKMFPQRVNAGFMQVLDRGHIKLRVFERGVGETLACGSGACAAVVAGHLQGLLDNHVDVELPGGSLHIEWPGHGHPVIMTGPATTVFEGQILL